VSWDDDNFDLEFISFAKATQDDVALLSGNQTIMYVEVLWDTITDYTNTWNKKRKRVAVHKIERCINTPKTQDEVIPYELWLDMGARLFKEIKKHADKKPKYLRIIKDSNPLDKFDTWYHSYPYKLVKQEKITSLTKKKSKGCSFYSRL